MSNAATPAPGATPNVLPNIPNFPRPEFQARYKLFRKFAYDDQYSFYLSAINRNRQAASQVNRLRATMSLLTGLSSALAGLIVQVGLTGQNGDCFAHGQASLLQGCTVLQLLLNVLLLMAVLAPAIGGGLNILTDLYQWDRLISIYDSAQRNMKVAYSRIPEDDMPENEYRLSITLFTADTLNVMYEEAGQWGQSVHSPAAIASFLDEAAKRASDAASSDGGKAADADSLENPLMVAGSSQATNTAPVPPPAPLVPVPNDPVVASTTPDTTATPIASAPAATTPIASTSVVNPPMFTPSATVSPAAASAPASPVTPDPSPTPATPATSPSSAAPVANEPIDSTNPPPATATSVSTSPDTQAEPPASATSSTTPNTPVAASTPDTATPAASAVPASSPVPASDSAAANVPAANGDAAPASTPVVAPSVVPPAPPAKPPMVDDAAG